MNCDNLKDLEKFLQVQEQALGAACPEVASTIAKIADRYLKEGNLDQAECYYRRALEIRQGLQGPHRSEIAESEKCLENVLKLKQRANQTPIQVQSLEMEEHPLKISHNEVSTRSRAANLEKRTNEISDAETELMLLRNTI